MKERNRRLRQENEWSGKVSCWGDTETETRGPRQSQYLAKNGGGYPRLRTPAKGPKARETRHPGSLDDCGHLKTTAFFPIARKLLFNNSSIILLRINNLFFNFQNSPSRISLFENVDICHIVSSLDYIKGTQYHLHNTSDF